MKLVRYSVRGSSPRLGALAGDRIRCLGETYHRLCGEAEPDRCTVVQAHRYDPVSGYVNAVGGLEARSGRLRIVSFAPLGEAIFS